MLMSAQRLKIGVVGCGAIAQSQHLPNLIERPDIWEVAAVCDVSPKLVEAVGDRFQVPRRYTDYHALMESDVDAVLLCLADPKTPAALEAAKAGKHILIEKPMCFTVAEADSVLAAAKAGGIVLMMGYMKQHEPGFQYARERILAMRDIRFIQVNHLHPDNSLHMRDFRILKFDDIPPDVREEHQRQRERRVAEAIGENATATERFAFNLLNGSMIHDISCLRGIFGEPERVVSSEIWRQGRGFTFVLAYPGERRCVATWVDLPNLWDFKETLEVYGSDQRVILNYPTGFSRGVPTTITLQGSEEGVPWRKEMVLSRDPGFQAEIAHFHDCIVHGRQPLTTCEGARADTALVAEIMRVARKSLAAGPVPS
jgi:predicted dehydrogenase